MTTFDRYIIVRISIGFVSLICMLTVFFIAMHYVEFMDDFFDRGATTREVFAVYYPSLIPEIIKLTAPLALFLSAIFVTARLAQQLQIAVLLTSGVSIYRLMVPYLVLGMAVTGAIWWFNGWIVPEANVTRIDYEYRYFKDQRGAQRTRDLHLQETPTSVLTAEYYDRRAETAYAVSIQRFNTSNRIEERLDAREMQWIDSTRIWRMFEVTHRLFDDEGSELRIQSALLDTTLNVLPRDLSRTERDVELLTIPEAEAYLAALRRSGASNMGRPLVEYWSKFTYPFANLILIALSFPLAAVRRPGGQAVQLGIGFGVAFLYLVLQKLAEPLAYSGSIPPFVAAAMPHIVFAVLAIVIVMRTRT
jgi:lipopolysaccharide export system permease protein